MAIAWMAKDWPRSTCTHCVPFLNSTASSSTASFLPSVIRLSSPRYGGTLLVTGLPAATFVTPLGTSIGGGATSEGGSMFGPAGKSSGVPLSVWRGRSSLSGSVALASSARTADAKQATVNARINRDLNKALLIKLTTIHGRWRFHGQLFRQISAGVNGVESLLGRHWDYDCWPSHAARKAPMNRTHSKRFARGRVIGPRVSVWSACVFSAAFPRQGCDSMLGQVHGEPTRLCDRASGL